MRSLTRFPSRGHLAEDAVSHMVPARRRVVFIFRFLDRPWVAAQRATLSRGRQTLAKPELAELRNPRPHASNLPT